MGHEEVPSLPTHATGTSSSTSHDDDRPRVSVHTGEVSLRIWGDSTELENRTACVLLLRARRREVAIESFMMRFVLICVVTVAQRRAFVQDNIPSNPCRWRRAFVQ